MLRKNGFLWTKEVVQTFEDLKQALVSVPILSLPDFFNVFVVETDACNVGVGAVLTQDGHPITYRSKALTPKAKPFSTYEKEILAIVIIVGKW